ncbi:unnamed protein product [Phaedon cochleariae]|uniref:Flavin-containing monooxygenase n=1 Tax=Phaedon cochleariae TaxID=80249 RepID=A0A9N9SHM7_PHACE|nr:unnamed protein product [Phaedon cochleariae]
MKICIVGAGAAGLAALKHSLDEGHDCELFEQTGFIGGVWKYVDKVGLDEFGLPIHTSMYEDLRTNLPKELMMFEDFPYKKELTRSYISFQEVYEYIEAYAEFFNLSTHIKLYHHLEAVSPIHGGKWSVQVKNLRTKKVETKDFDSIIICVGNYSDPIVPKLPGENEFAGSIIHSHDYRNTDPYKNKTVLVVGVGPSGIDIAAKVLAVAKKVIQCQRTAKIEYGLKIAEGVIVKPEVDEIFEKSVKFIDGSVEEIDDIILCTGYRFSFPFLTPQCGLEVEDHYVKYLYKHTINIEHPTMAFIGMPKNIPLFPSFCLQVSWLNQLFFIPGVHSRAMYQPFTDTLYIYRARFYLAFLRGNLGVTKEEMREDVENFMKECKQSGQQPNTKIDENGFRQFYEELATLAHITPMKPVIPNIFDYLEKEGFGNHNINYKILNDEDFEHDL